VTVTSDDPGLTQEVSSPPVALPRTSRRRRRALAIASFPLTLVLFGCLSLAIGQDRNGDQLAYHVPWLWSLFNGQQDLAWSPGGAGSLVPSMWNVPWYLAARHWPPQAVVFYLGALHGVALWLVGAIAWTLTAQSGRLRLPLTAVAVVVGFLAPATMTEFGTTFGDLPTAILILGAILVVLRRDPTTFSARAAVFVGFLLGAAVGFKLTNAVWFIAALPAVAVWTRSRGSRLAKQLGAALLGAVGGALATGGYWWWLMWDRFDNPLFPFYNGVFGSSYGWIENQRDDRFLLSPLEALLMPLRMAVGGYPSEFEGRDIRWALIAELAIVALVVWRIQARRGEPAPSRLTTSPARRFLLTFAAVGWVAWLLQFGIARYLVPLELLSGILLICLADLVTSRSAVKAALVAGGAVLSGALVVVPAFQHTHWGETWFQFATPELARQPDTLVVFPTDAPLAHALVAFPSDTMAVQAPTIYRVYGMDDPPRYTSRADDEVRQAIVGHQGPIVAVTPWEKPYLNQARRVATKYGKSLPVQDCEPMHSLYGNFAVCPWVPAP
jgi:hypothetical protein